MKKRQSKNKLGIATTLSAAAAKTGLTMETVKAIQAGGSAAFKPNGRVDCDQLLDDVAKSPATNGAADFFIEKALDMRASRMLKEQKLAERAKLLVPVEDVKRTWRNITIAAKIKMNATTGELSAQAQMRLNLTNEQAAMIRELHTKLMRRVQQELYTRNWGPITCPFCKGELTNEK